MPTANGSPTVYEAVPFPGVPPYFHRRWSPSEGKSPALDIGMELMGESLDIFGYSCRSTFPEDWPTEDDAFKAQGAFPGICFSVREPDGEYGFTPVQAVTAIELWELEAALANLGVGWIDPALAEQTFYKHNFYGLGKLMHGQRRGQY